MKHIALLLVLLTSSSLLHSEEIRYVNDVLVIQLRTGPSFNHRNFKGLISGTKLTLLEMDEEQKWSHVRLGNGEEGWVPAQYLSDQPAARNQLQSATRENEQLRQQNSELKQQLAELSEQEQQARTKLEQLTGQSQQLSSELSQVKSISANSLQLNSDNKRLLQENQALKNEVDVLSTDNKRLNDARKSDNFMNGAFAVVIGVFITLMVAMLWPKKRNEWA